MPTDGERLATLEEQVRDFGDDMRSLADEVRGVRVRVHNLEGIAGTFVSIQQANREAEKRQYDRLGTRIQLALLLVGIAAVLTPILTVLLTGKG